MNRPIFILIAFVFVCSSCATFNPSVLFREAPNFQFDKFTTGPDSLYQLAENDIIDVRILTNNGDNLINVTGNVAGGAAGIKILIEYDGTCKFPFIGRVKLAGLTRREAEDTLEALFKGQYRDPFITITISNRKVLVFPGTGNSATVVNFTGDNMNLIEALAFVGGISNLGIAKKVKLIRGDLKNPKVYKIDLSTLDGMKEADLALQSGDIIYVDPLEDPAILFNTKVTPYIALLGTISGIITSVALIIVLTK